MNIYAIHDAAAKYFLPPFTAPTDGVAKRMFVASMGDSFPHRADFTLHLVGSFDEDQGTLSIPQSGPRLVLAGLSVDPRLDPRRLSQPEGEAA